MWTQDVRYAIRILRRSPGFAATAILTLAVCIGANAAIWSAIKGILVAPLPYPDPDRLVRLFEEASTTPHFPFSPADFRDYRAELRTFEGIAAYGRSDLQLGEAQPPEQLRGMRVSAGFFKVVGHPPVLGRDIEQGDELQGHADVVILSHGFWMRRFQGDPGAVGRTIRLSGRPFRIVGVLPRGLQHVGGTYQTYGHGEPVDVWWPLAVPREEHPRHRFSHYYNVVGRVRRDASRAAMEEDLRQAGASAASRYPAPPSPWQPRAVPLKDEIVGTAASTLGVLAGAALAAGAPAAHREPRPGRRGRDAGSRPRVWGGLGRHALRARGHATPVDDRRGRAGARARFVRDGPERGAVRARAGLAAGEDGGGGGAEGRQPRHRGLRAAADATCAG